MARDWEVDVRLVMGKFRGLPGFSGSAVDSVSVLRGLAMPTGYSLMAANEESQAE